MHPSIAALLRCPRCRGELTPAADGEAPSYTCARCAVRFRARDGVLDFTPDSAEPVAPAAR